MHAIRRFLNITEASEWLQIFRGEYSGNKNGYFYSPSREFARQFTQSGQEHEVKVRWIRRQDVYDPPTPVYAGDEASVDSAIAEAKSHGFKAVRLGEGNGEPPSLYVFDRSALRMRE